MIKNDDFFLISKIIYLLAFKVQIYIKFTEHKAQ